MARAGLRVTPVTGAAGVANAHWRVGHMLSLLGEHAAAEAAFRRSVAYYEQLAADFPGVTDYRGDLAMTQHSLDSLLRSTGRRQEAEATYHDALVLRQHLVAEFSKVPRYRHDSRWRRRRQRGPSS